MPNAFISLIVDDITQCNLIDNRSKIFELIDEFIPITIDIKFNKMTRSRWLKTSMRELIKGDILYIDNDTIIAEDLSSINDFEGDIAAILDDHRYLSEYEKYRPSRFREVKRMFKVRNFDNKFDFQIYFNGGILFFRDTKISYDFFKEWHRLWLHCFELDLYSDQPSLNQANYNLGKPIRILNGIWNCQLMHDGSLQYIHDSKILHYFATHVHEKFFLLANNEYIELIKRTGYIDDKIKKMLNNPKSQFAANTRIMLIDSSYREFYDSATCGAVKRIYQSKFGIFIEFFLLKIKKYFFTPLRKKIYSKKNIVYI